MLQRDRNTHSRESSRENHLCQFCKNSYSRRDALQRHSIICPKRGSNPLPDFRRARGRGRHACNSCATKKISCDGTSPCSTCITRGLNCLRPGSDTSSTTTSPSTYSRATDEARDDRGSKPCSVAFLLRDGEEEVFTSRFNFPRRAPSSPTASRSQVEVYVPSKGSNDANVGFDFEFLESIFDPSFFSADIWPGGNASHLETWLDSPQIPNDDDDYDIYGVSGNEDKLNVIIKSILCVPSVTRLGEAEQKSVTAQLKHLFAPTRTARFLRYYFDCWHRNCRYVHKPSFSVEDTNEPLLASMALLGAMYSPDEDERTMASEIMYHAEKYIFFHEPLFGEQSLGKCSAAAKHGDFQTIQAGLCMLVIQFWTGDEAAKQRAMTLRFDQTIKAAQASGLLAARQQLEDRVSESSWLRKESMIRTATWLILLDCAFLFYKGIPLRVPSSEIEGDFPCDEAIFDASHPFTEPAFSFRRIVSPCSAFRTLFPSEVSISLTMLDTFILVHMLYRYANDLLQLALFRQLMTPVAGMLAETVRALDTWHEHWEALKEDAVSRGVWDKMGFYRNGNQYEAATRLLLSETARPHLTTLVKSNVDRLNLLKRLTSADWGGLS